MIDFIKWTAQVKNEDISQPSDQQNRQQQMYFLRDMGNVKGFLYSKNLQAIYDQFIQKLIPAARQEGLNLSALNSNPGPISQVPPQQNYQ